MSEPSLTENAAEVAYVDETQSNTAQLVYLLQALGFFLGITFIAGVVINYVKRGDITDSVVADHFTWQIRTFWWSLLWALLGMILMVVVVGYFIMLANGIWVIYRIAKGWMRLREKKPAY